MTAREVLVSAVAAELAQPADQKPQNAFQTRCRDRT
jgi:hypothetical protein